MQWISVVVPARIPGLQTHVGDFSCRKEMVAVLAAAIILSSDRHGFHWVFLDAEQYDVSPVFLEDFHIGDDAWVGFLLDFINPFGHGLFPQPDPTNIPVVLNAKEYSTSFRIGK